eukprot:CAMPEP_0178590620 /NCGR_PEP_ID=MMETSP0697-20121206/28321_1 /TAXON_ID=265572 /ORGANISM="Extubocellulus spinifer, Strain CCMP396" /LENGTH=37 /DNA_ID= /DNA_START= /DNA_END= /DNA_ORIENTATION=
MYRHGPDAVTTTSNSPGLERRNPPLRASLTLIASVGP